MEELVATMSSQAKQQQFMGWVPEEVVYLKGCRMVFYLKAGVRRSFFRGASGKPEEHLLWLPAMLFDYEGPRHKLNAWFCRGSIQDIREDKALLLPAMLPNITNASVCLGSSMNRSAFTEDAGEMMEVIIDTFFNSTFNEWRFEGMRELIGTFIEIAKEPDTELVKGIENAFWQNLHPSITEYIKKHPWVRASRMFGR